MATTNAPSKDTAAPPTNVLKTLGAVVGLVGAALALLGLYVGLTTLGVTVEASVLAVTTVASLALLFAIGYYISERAPIDRRVRERYRGPRSN